MQYLYLVVIFTLSSPLWAQLTPAQAVAGMGRGINLGNTLEPPQEGAWNNGPAEEIYFDAYVQAGFTNVRIPVRWDEHTADTPPYAVDAAWMDRVEEVVDWGLERDLYVTLNGHHEDWLKNGYDDPALRDRYDSIWVQIIERFGNKSEKLLFEIINEPFGMTVAQVDDLNARILGLIRADDATRLVIYGGNVYSNSDELLAAAVPEDDYVIGYFHSYDPYNFAGLANGTWGTEQDYQQLDAKFRAVSEWSLANDVPVHLSEFGAVLQADYNSRMRWYAAYVEAALRYDFAFSVWDDGGMFAVLDRASNTWPEVKDILINTYADSPNQVTTTVGDTTGGTPPTVTVRWNNRSTEGDLIVERRVGEGDFTAIGEVAQGTTTYTDTEVTVGNFYTYRIVTEREDGTVLQSYPSRVLLAGEQKPFGERPLQLTDTLQVEDFDLGGELVAYHDQESTNIPGLYRPDEGVDIGTTGDGGFAVGYIAQREWLEYTVDVPAAGSYTFTASLATAQGGGSMQLSTDRSGILTNLRVPAEGTGSYDSYTSVPAAGVFLLDTGVQVLRIDITGEQPFNLDYLVFSAAEADSNAVVNYYDGLDTATTAFSGEPAGITFALDTGVLTVVGDGTSPAYQTFRYTLPEPLRADAIGSNNLLYIGARTRSGAAVNLRVDLIDENDFHTTLANRSNSIGGPDYGDYRYDYTGGYQDGGYGGTACSTGPCPVEGARITAVSFYPNPEAGMFNDTLDIDYISFGNVPDTTGTGGEATGVVNYQDELDDAGPAFSGTPAGITYSVTDGILSIAGDGTSGPYSPFTYSVRGEDGGIGLVDAAGSNDLLFIRARTVSGDTANLRIDLADRDNYHTTLNAANLRIGGPDFGVYSINFAGRYADGGYGGTACASQGDDCPVDAQRIAGLILYPEAEAGAFADTIEIDYISFGAAITVNVRELLSLDRLTVYPNPARTNVTLDLQLATQAVLVAEVYNAYGQRMLTRTYGQLPAGDRQLSLPVGDLAAGTYFIRLRVDNRYVRALPLRIE